MRYRLLLLLSAILIACGSSVHAQCLPQPTPFLRQGDTVPDMTLQMVNYKTQTVKLSDFRGKLLILDFWSIFCSSCIEAFPRLQALQAEFGDKLAIIPVTGYGESYGSREKIEAFFENQRKLGHPVMPSVVDDTVLYKLFPAFMGLPMEVWIDSTGKVLSVTDGETLKSPVIRDFLAGKFVSLPQRKPGLPEYNTFKPWLVENNGGPDSAFVCRSMFTAYNPMFYGSSQINTDSGTRICLANKTLFGLFREAIIGSLPNRAVDIFQYDIFHKRFIQETPHRRPFGDWDDIAIDDYWGADSFASKHLYCYELILPGNCPLREAYRYVLEDLCRFFGLSYAIEYRSMKCWALVRSGSIRQSYGTDAIVSTTENHLSFEAKNSSLAELIYYLNTNIRTKFNFVDRTGLKYNTDIKIDLPDLTDLRVLRRQLRRFGMDIEERIVPLKMVVLRERSEDLSRLTTRF